MGNYFLGTAPASPFRQRRRIGVARAMDILQPRSGDTNRGTMAPRRSVASRDRHIVVARLVSPLPGLRSRLSSRSRGLRPWLLWVAPSGDGEPDRVISKSTPVARAASTRRPWQTVQRAQFPDEPISGAFVVNPRQIPIHLLWRKRLVYYRQIGPLGFQMLNSGRSNFRIRQIQITQLLHRREVR